jgi:hypothetical protein
MRRAGPPVDRPCRAATHEDGAFGYVPDEGALRRDPPPLGGARSRVLDARQRPQAADREGGRGTQRHERARGAGPSPRRRESPPSEPAARRGRRRQARSGCRRWAGRRLPAARGGSGASARALVMTMECQGRGGMKCSKKRRRPARRPSVAPSSPPTAPPTTSPAVFDCSDFATCAGGGGGACYVFVDGTAPLRRVGKVRRPPGERLRQATGTASSREAGLGAVRVKKCGCAGSMACFAPCPDPNR